jgi:Tfp pilus assembly protein PilO
VAPVPTIKRRLAIDRQQFLILLIAAVMVGSFCLLVLWPKHCELSDLGSVVARERDMVSEKARASQDGLYVSARLSALRRVQDHLMDRLPDEPRLAEFLQSVAECVQAEPGVTHEIERTEAAPAGRLAAVPIRLRLAGPYDGVHRCLASIENLQRVNRFRHVQINRSTDDGHVVATAEILVFHLSPGARQDEGRAVATKPSEVADG